MGSQILAILPYTLYHMQAMHTWPSPACLQWVREAIQMRSIVEGFELWLAFDLPSPLSLCPRVKGRPEATRIRP